MAVAADRRRKIIKCIHFVKTLKLFKSSIDLVPEILILKEAQRSTNSVFGVSETASVEIEYFDKVFSLHS